MSKRNSKSLKERALGVAGSNKINSKVKGNRNEVSVARFLSEWTGVEFRRTPASGAIHVPLDWLNGDVFCTNKDFDFPFSVEAKHYDKIYPKMKSDWWIQTCNDAARINKFPMLFYRSNGWKRDTWTVRMVNPSGLFTYIMHKEFVALPLDGTRPAMEVKSYHLKDINYVKFLNLYRDEITKPVPAGH